MSAPSLDLLAATIQLRHAELSHRPVARTYADPCDVGRCAAKLAQHFFDAVTEDAGGGVHAARTAGLLVYAMELYGYSYEDMVDLADQQIASVVSGLTPDIRLPPGRRVGAHCTQLLESGNVISHIVQLAEIAAVLTRIEQTYDAAALVEHAERVKGWAQDALAIHGALTKLHAAPRMAVPLRRIKDRLVALARRVDQARRPSPPAAVVVVVAEPV